MPLLLGSYGGRDKKGMQNFGGKPLGKVPH
jgi:hypothetical protein